jgi:fructose/tagatose bisphosphate aldolase
MPIATTQQYAAMLDRASAGGCALPGVNVSSSDVFNAALRPCPWGREAEAATPATAAYEQLGSAGGSVLR